MNKSNFKRFTIEINLGHRIARLIVHAKNTASAIFKAFVRFEHKQNNFNQYKLKTTRYGNYKQSI